MHFSMRYDNLLCTKPNFCMFYYWLAFAATAAALVLGLVASCSVTHCLYDCMFTPSRKHEALTEKG